MNAETFIAFLQKLRQDAGCPVFIIADKYHHSKKVSAFLETQAGQIMMAFLPPYIRLSDILMNRCGTMRRPTQATKY